MGTSSGSRVRSDDFAQPKGKAGPERLFKGFWTAFENSWVGGEVGRPGMGFVFVGGWLKHNSGWVWALHLYVV